MSSAAATAPAKLDRYFGAPLNPKTNSLNLIRLIFAATVLFAHTYFLLGIPVEDQPSWGNEHLGVWAVAGFFALSGYLITASRQRTGFANFLLLRIARIFPAFLAVLVVTAAVFGPIAHMVTHGTLSGYLRTAPSPGSYIFTNMFLEIHAYGIGSTLSEVPYANVWNGSLWSLFYEFFCYIFIGVFLIWAYARKTVWPTALAFVVSVLVYINIDFILTFFDLNASFRLITMVLPYFLGGALIRMLMPKFGLHWVPGVISLAAVIIGIEFGPYWTAQLLAPLLAYGLLWTSTVIPQPRWVGSHDISYGIYVYAFPVQQILVVFGLSFMGPIWLSLVALVITAALSIASWFWIERPALRRARQATGRSADRMPALV